jgi:hypothetical protein
VADDIVYMQFSLRQQLQFYAIVQSIVNFSFNLTSFYFLCLCRPATMFNSTLSFISIASERNESSTSTASREITWEIPDVVTVSVDADDYAFKVFTILNYIIGCTGVVTNLFVIMVIIGFMEVKAKV